MIKRLFEFVKDEFAKPWTSLALPERKTIASAGYDFYVPHEVEIKPGETVMIWTNVKAKMPQNEFLAIFVRSSVGIKRHLMLANGTCIIDSDYYSNPDNDGNIGIPIYNYGKETQIVEAGECLAQGIFLKFKTTDDDTAKAIRMGGYGSTGR